MKQSLQPASSEPWLVVVVTIAMALLASACGTVTRRSSTTPEYNLALPKAERASVININTATLQELEKLPGVGKAIAERIVEHREHYGPFRHVEHLMMVRGISDRKFRQLRTMIVVELSVL